MTKLSKLEYLKSQDRSPKIGPIVAAVAILAGVWLITSDAKAHDVDAVYRTGDAKPALSKTVRHNEQTECMARLIFTEASGEPYSGQMAVAHVVMNRVKSPRYPHTICEVAKQNKLNKRKVRVWQFSGMNPHSPSFKRSNSVFNYTTTNAIDIERRELAYEIAETVKTDLPPFAKTTLHYHALSVKPRWADTHKFVRRIDNHDFYAGVQ